MKSYNYIHNKCIVILQIHLPDNVSKRCYHSLSSLVMSPTNVLLVVFGGQRMFLGEQISDTHVIELGEYTYFHTFSFV